jgi:hypothetical protein
MNRFLNQKLNQGDLVSIVGWDGSINPQFWNVNSKKLESVREGSIVLIIGESKSAENWNTLFMWSDQVFEITIGYDGWWEPVPTSD